MKSRFLVGVFVVACCCGIVLSDAANNTDTYGEAFPHIKVRQGPYNMHPDGKKRAEEYATDYSPSQLKSLYNMHLGNTAGTGKTIAIIDAYAHAAAEADLNVFANEYNLPACTTANGCFKRVDQNGGTNYITTTNSAWNQEVSLDLQWVHAIAPGANKILVEANSASMGDLMTAIQYAATVADYVSMSFGAGETSYTGYESIFTTENVSFFASTGDNGEAVNYPAISPNVIAVGGTTLYVDADTEAFAQETGWGGSGGGCSSYFTASAQQQPYLNGVCSGNFRGIPDVSYLADPNSGVAIYVSDGCDSAPNCWYSVGGTSLAAPMMAARSAINGSVINHSFIYGDDIVFRDIVIGNNGYNCTVGYDLVTGRGSWINDVGAPAISTGTTSTTGSDASGTTGRSNHASTTSRFPGDEFASTTRSANEVSSATSTYLSVLLLVILAVLNVL